MADRSRGEVAAGTISSWESGKAKDPGGEVYAKVARVFSVPVQEIYAALGLLPGGAMRRETARELLQRALVQLGEPLPVYPLSAYGREANVRQSEADVHVVPIVVEPGHRLEAYRVSEAYPSCGLDAGAIVVVDLDADVKVNDVCLFVLDDVRHPGVLRKFAGELWVENDVVRRPFAEVSRVARVCQKTAVL